MFKVLETKEKIEFSYNKLINELKISFDEKIFGTVNCLGGKFSADLFYSPEFNLWLCHKAEEKRFWTAFGVGRPENKGLRIFSEINIPCEGVNRALAAAFIEDLNGNVALIHRGKIRGGKEFFFRNFTGNTIDILDGSKKEKVALISKLDSTNIAGDLSKFVKEIIAMKSKK